MSFSASGSKNVYRAVIPAAGLGTRLRPLSNAFPKELLPVGRKPVLAYIMEELRAAGISDVLFIVSEAKPQIRGYFGDTYRGETGDLDLIRCSYVFQVEQRGLGDAIGLARAWAQGEPFVVAFGDCIIESEQSISPLQRLVQSFSDNGAVGATLVEEVAPELVTRYGIVAPVEQSELGADTNGSMLLKDIVEKPAIDDAPSRFAVAARWVLSSDVFEYLERGVRDSRGEVNLTDAVRMMARDKGGLWAVKLKSNEARRDIGNFGSFFNAFVRAALRDSEYGAAVARTVREELERIACGTESA